jgi:transposase-like protein
MPKVYTEAFKLLCVEFITGNELTISAASFQLDVGKRSLITWLNLHNKGQLVCEKENNQEKALQKLRLENKRLMRGNIALNAQLKSLSE